MLHDPARKIYPYFWMKFSLPKLSVYWARESIVARWQFGDHSSYDKNCIFPAYQIALLENVGRLSASSDRSNENVFRLSLKKLIHCWGFTTMYCCLESLSKMWKNRNYCPKSAVSPKAKNCRKLKVEPAAPIERISKCINIPAATIITNLRLYVWRAGAKACRAGHGQQQTCHKISAQFEVKCNCVGNLQNLGNRFGYHKESATTIQAEWMFKIHLGKTTVLSKNQNHKVVIKRYPSCSENAGNAALIPITGPNSEELNAKTTLAGKSVAQEHT